MKIITIKSITATKKKPVEVKNTLLWYDVKTKKMHTFVGGQLKFAYDSTTKEQTVSVEKLFRMGKVDRKSIWSIREWYQENEDRYKLSLVEDTERQLVFSAKNDEMIEELEGELYQERFDYTIEDYDKS